jgi:protein-arginine kinase activator protein McsA
VSPKEILNFIDDYVVEQTVGNYLTVQSEHSDFQLGDLVFTKCGRSYLVSHGEGCYVYCFSWRKRKVFPILKRKITRRVVAVNHSVSKLVNWETTTTEQAWETLSKVGD